MRFIKTKIFAFLMFMLCMGVFCVTAYAADGGGETLTVNAAWVDGDMLRIIVTDANNENSALALRLSDYVSDVENSEYISIQAVDLAGNKSEVIHIKNPYYIPSKEPDKKTDETPPITVEITSSEPTESAVPDGKNPFTPDGSGTVMDNVAEGNGKEFFTVKAEDGSVFYLIIDRQRNSENVYFLNAVTEDDLIALAKKNNKDVKNGNTSAIPTPETETTNANAQNQTTTAAPEPEPKPPSKGINPAYILIILAVIAAGGAGYYFKIVKGKKNVPDSDEDNDDDDNNGDEQEENGDDEYDGGEELDEEDDI